MNNNINSLEADAALALDPLHLPGSKKTVQPPGYAHLGVPLSIYSATQRLAIVIDPLVMLASSQNGVLGGVLKAFDTLTVWVNGLATGASDYVRPGQESERMLLYLPPGWLKNDINKMFYRVERLSGNYEDSLTLDVLYYTPASDIKVSHPATIGQGQPPTFTLTRNYPNEFDVMRLTVGRWSKTIPYVHPANPITYTLTAAERQQIGDGPHLVEATVTDQLGNHNVSGRTTITFSDWQDDYTDFEKGFNGWIPHNAARSGSIRVFAGRTAFFNFTDQLPATGFRGTVLYKDFLCPPGSYVFQMKACHVADNPAAGLLNPLLQLQAGIAGGDGDVREVPKNGIWYDFRLSINVPAQGIVRFYIQNHQDGSHGNDFGIDDIQVIRTSGMGGVMGVLNEAPPCTGPVTPIALI